MTDLQGKEQPITDNYFQNFRSAFSWVFEKYKQIRKPIRVVNWRSNVFTCTSYVRNCLTRTDYGLNQSNNHDDDI